MTAAGEADITVLIVADPHRKPVFLAELARTGRYRPIGLLESPAQALEPLRQRLPDVLVVEVTSLEHIDQVAALRAAVDDLRAVLVSALPAELALMAGLAAGARGFVQKPVQGGVLGQAVSAVAAGHAYIDPRCTQWLVEVALHGRNARTDHALSPRQAQVVRLASAGLTNREIGRIMQLSAETVKTHLQQAMRRLGVHDRLHAAALVEAPSDE